MNKIRVNHHDMNYLQIMVIWLTIHWLLCTAILSGCYKLNEGKLSGWLFLVLGSGIIIGLAHILDKSIALVVWDDKTIRIKYHKYTETVNISQIDSFGYSVYTEYHGERGGQLRLKLDIKAEGNEYSLNEPVPENAIERLLSGDRNVSELIKLYDSLEKLCPFKAMGYEGQKKWRY